MANTKRKYLMLTVKGVASLILLSLIIYILIYPNLSMYFYKQISGQIRLMSKVEKIEHVLKDSTYSDKLKGKLRIVTKVKAFAEDKLGLKKTKNYTTFYNQKGEPVMWLVKACPPYKLSPYKWKFPVIGEFLYKGFFEKSMAIDEIKRLKNQGYDIRLGQVQAWSTLNIMKDPVLSGILDRSVGEFAETIIHELTHATIFVKDNLRFNENLATFIGEKGSELFLKENFGEASKELTLYLKERKDTRSFVSHMLSGAKKLDSLYSSFKNDAGKHEKELKKQETISQIIADADTIHFELPQEYNFLKNENYHPNNAYFIGFLTYRLNQSNLDSLYSTKYNNNLFQMVQDMKLNYSSFITWTSQN